MKRAYALTTHTAPKSQWIAKRDPLTENNVRVPNLKDSANVRTYLAKGESVEAFQRLRDKLVAEIAPVGDQEMKWAARTVIMRWRQMRLKRKQDVLVLEGHKLIKRKNSPLPIPKLLRVLSVSPFGELRDQIMDLNLEINMLDRSCLHHSYWIKNSKLKRQMEQNQIHGHCV